MSDKIVRFKGVSKVSKFKDEAVSDEPTKKNQPVQLPDLDDGNIKSLKVQVIKPSAANANNPGGQPSAKQSHQMINPQPRDQGESFNGKADQAEEELSTFFRQRRLAQQTDSLSKYLLVTTGKVLVFVLFAVATFIFLWNYATPLRVKGQSFAISRLQVNLAAMIPAWTRNAKKFREQNTTELGQFHLRGAQKIEAPSEVVRDPLIAAVLHGYWPKVERAIGSSCPKWQATESCAMKAWYQAYKGMRASLKPMLVVDMTAIKSLPKTQHALFIFAMSQAVVGQRSDELFDESLKVAEFDKGLQRVLFDAKFKSVVRDGEMIALPRIVAKSSKISVEPADTLKWRALEAVARIRANGQSMDKTSLQLARKEISGFVQAAPSLLKGDPVTFVLLAMPAMRFGSSKEIAKIAEAIVVQESPREFDPTLYRDISTLAVRSQMASGQLAEAISRVGSLRKQLGPDAVTSHLLGSALLAMRNSSRLVEAARDFQLALQGQSHWQSQLGYFLALTRSGQLKEAEQQLTKLQRINSTPGMVWISLAIAEFRLTVGEKSQRASLGYFKKIATDLAPIYAKKPDWPTVADLYAKALLLSGQAEKARVVQSKADELADKIRYVSSAEFLESPLGPYALSR